MCIVVTLVLILTILCHLKCAPLVKNDVKFSIGSSRNRTGHWNALVQFQHGDNDGRPMNVGLNHTTTRLEGHEDVLITVSLSGPRQRPGADYELLPGLGYYKFHTVPKNWFEARKVCEQEGTHLAIMNSEEESKALRKFWIPHPKLFEDWKNNWAYVGIHDHYSEGNYITIFDVPLNETGFTEWHSYQPDGGVSQNCIVIQRGSGVYGDVQCTDVLTFFCEQEL